MPEQIALGIVLPARLEAGDDLSELRMQRRLGQFAGFDMRAQASELAAFALPPVIDDELCHDIRQRQLDRAHCSIGYHEGAPLDPFGLQERRRLVEAWRLDHDVGAFDTSLPVFRRDHLLAEITAQPFGEAVAAFLSARMDADFVEIKQMIEQAHIPVGRPARADMAEYL